MTSRSAHADGLAGARPPPAPSETAAPGAAELTPAQRRFLRLVSHSAVIASSVRVALGTSLSADDSEQSFTRWLQSRGYGITAAEALAAMAALRGSLVAWQGLYASDDTGHVVLLRDEELSVDGVVVRGYTWANDVLTWGDARDGGALAFGVEGLTEEGAFVAERVRKRVRATLVRGGERTGFAAWTLAVRIPGSLVRAAPVRGDAGGPLAAAKVDEWSGTYQVTLREGTTSKEVSDLVLEVKDGRGSLQFGSLRLSDTDFSAPADGADLSWDTPTSHGRLQFLRTSDGRRGFQGRIWAGDAMPTANNATGVVAPAPGGALEKWNGTYEVTLREGASWHKAPDFTLALKGSTGTLVFGATRLDGTDFSRPLGGAHLSWDTLDSHGRLTFTVMPDGRRAFSGRVWYEGDAPAVNNAAGVIPPPPASEWTGSVITSLVVSNVVGVLSLVVGLLGIVLGPKIHQLWQRTKDRKKELEQTGSVSEKTERAEDDARSDASRELELQDVQLAELQPEHTDLLLTEEDVESRSEALEGEERASAQDLRQLEDAADAATESRREIAEFVARVLEQVREAEERAAREQSGEAQRVLEEARAHEAEALKREREARERVEHLEHEKHELEHDHEMKREEHAATHGKV